MLRSLSVSTHRILSKRPALRLQSTVDESQQSHFDTLKFVDQLRADGLSQAQAESILASVSTVINQSVASLSNDMVTRVDQEKYQNQYKSDFSHLKAEIHLLEKNDFAILKQENERLVGEVEKLKSKVREDLQRVQSGMRLDMNLDKARVRDEQSVLQLKINEAQSKMEQEASQLNAAIDNVKLDAIKTIGAAATSIGLLILGWARYFKS
eukprot:Partr_v1_DN23013_c0_g1_i1_m27082 putative Coiledcoil domain containing